MERGGQAFQVSREKWGKMGKSGLYKTVREDNVFSEFDLSPLSTTFYRFPSHFPSSHISFFRYHVLRNNLVSAINVGQVTFASDGQTCITTISTTSLANIVEQCRLHSKGDSKLIALAKAGSLFIQVFIKMC
jgi:hypothetical protein